MNNSNRYSMSAAFDWSERHKPHRRKEARFFQEALMPNLSNWTLRKAAEYSLFLLRINLSFDSKFHIVYTLFNV